MPESVSDNPLIRVLAAVLKQWGCQKVFLILNILKLKIK
ncbi:hypothetical protein LptCag_1077 [Leptospirillum ferriphilum]|uniref:Uncharacterized protein n=1 Tax=Leptospirillum ferriphilum TaxID=178606 RepID=A0A094X6Y3_9BACT|nr:hypothetical protein LptCag_1077 [Leptospirillum ferriphilum]